MAVLGTGIALVGYGIGSELNKVGIVNVQGGWYFTLTICLHKINLLFGWIHFLNWESD